MTDSTTIEESLESARQELARVTLTRFTNEDAWNAAAWAVTEANARALPIVIDIRRGDQQLVHVALSGTNADNDSWVERKIRTVRRYGIASLRLNELYTRFFGDFNEMTKLPFNEYVASGGCVPIMIENVGMIGTLTVSGLTDEMDHAFAIEVLEHLLRSHRQ